MSAELRRLGIEAVRQQRFGDAVRWLAKYVVTAPDDDAEARLALALAYAGTGDASKALTIIDRLLIQQPPSANLHYQRAAVLERLDRKQDAIEAYRQALGINPNHEKARKRLLALDDTAPPAVVDVVENAVLLEDEIVQDAVLIEDRPRIRAEPVSSNTGIFIALGVSVALIAITCLVVFMSRSNDDKNNGVPTTAPSHVQINPTRPTDENPFKQVDSKRPGPPDMRKFDDNAVDEAIATLRGKESTWYSHALITLSHLKPNGRQNEVVALVVPLLDGGDISVRILALDTLKGWGTRDCLPAIRKLVSDTHPIIKRKAADAITAIEQRS